MNFISMSDFVFLLFLFSCGNYPFCTSWLLYLPGFRSSFPLSLTVLLCTDEGMLLHYFIIYVANVFFLIPFKMYTLGHCLLNMYMNVDNVFM